MQSFLHHICTFPE